MNLRPLDPQSSALAKLRHIPCCTFTLLNCRLRLKLGKLRSWCQLQIAPLLSTENCGWLELSKNTAVFGRSTQRIRNRVISMFQAFCKSGNGVLSDLSLLEVIDLFLQSLIEASLAAIHQRTFGLGSVPRILLWSARRFRNETDFTSGRFGEFISCGRIARQFLMHPCPTHSSGGDRPVRLRGLFAPGRGR